MDPERRYPNAQAVLDALEARRARIVRRPMMLFGTLGPVLLLAVVLGLTWLGSSRLKSIAQRELLDRALKSTDYAARFSGQALELALEKRFKAVEEMAQSEKLQSAMAAFQQHEKLGPLLDKLSEADAPAEKLATMREQFVAHPDRRSSIALDIV